MFCKFTKLYYKLLKISESLSDTLDSLGVSMDMKVYVMNSPSNKVSKYIAILKENPDIEANQIDELINKKENSPDRKTHKDMLNESFEKIKEKIPENKVEDANLVLKSQFPDESKFWALKQVLEGFSSNDIIPTINYFHNNISKFEEKNINKYLNIKELENLVKEINYNKIKNIRDDIDDTLSPIIYENDEYVLFRPENKDACVSLGRGTQWCITMKDSDYYEEYTDRNVIFYFLIRKNRKNNDRDKLAFAIGRDDDNKLDDIEIYDQQDNLIDRGSLSSEEEKALKIAEGEHSSHPRSFISRIKSKDINMDELIDKLINMDLDDIRDLEDILEKLDKRAIEFVFYEFLNMDLFQSYLMESLVEYIETEEADYVIDYLKYFSKESIEILISKISPENLPDVYENLKKDLDNYIFDELAPLIINYMNKEDVSRYINEEDSEILEAVAENIDESYLPEMLDTKDIDILNIIYKRIDPKYLPEQLDKIREMYKHSILIGTIAKRIDDKFINYIIKEFRNNPHIPEILAQRLEKNDPRIYELLEITRNLVGKPYRWYLFKIIASKIPKEYFSDILRLNVPGVDSIIKERIESE